MDYRTILIAEDDTDDRFLFETAFADRGFTDKLIFFDNGVELLSYLNSLEKESSGNTVYPGFIILDLNMPKKDGREVLKEIKQHSVFRKIPVIVFTTTKNELEISRCYELGANTYIVKPVSYEDLIRVVELIQNYWFRAASIPGYE
ncbi:MAG TPA: response regulator [Parasegetibacter sp.]